VQRFELNPQFQVRNMVPAPRAITGRPSCFPESSSSHLSGACNPP